MDEDGRKKLSISEEFLQYGSSNLVQNGTLNYKGEIADKTKTGGWKVIPQIFGSETCERMAVTGLVFNLVYYLVVDMHLTKAYSVSFVSNAVGTGFLCTLLGGLLADQWLGRFRTVLTGCLIELVGLVLMTCQTTIHSFGLLSVLYLGIYTVALGNGVLKACAAPFGADQFDTNDSYEKALSVRYFTWYFFFSDLGSILAVTLLAWVQIEYSYGWGFGANAVLMAVATVAFVSGARVYRYSPCAGSPLTGVAKVFWQACRNINRPLPANDFELHELSASKHKLKFKGFQQLSLTDRLRFLNKASILPHTRIVSGQSFKSEQPDEGTAKSTVKNVPTVTEVEEVKQILYTLPILLATAFFWTVYAQISTFSVLQGIYMDKTVGTLDIPSASIGFFLYFFVLAALFFYDRVAYPALRRYTGLEEGLTSLQKIGTGMFGSILAMLLAGVVEAKRRHFAHSHAPTEKLSIFWLVPQYSLLGMAEAMIYTGQLEYFYHQSPPRLRSLGTSLCLCTVSVGYFISSAVVNIVQKYTKSSTDEGWLGNNLNKGHLDRFYYTLAIIDAISFAVLLVIARSFKYTKYDVSPPVVQEDLEDPIKPPKQDDGLTIAPQFPQENDVLAI